MFNIYVANLGAYNEGRLVGEWISLPCSQEDIEDLYVKIGIGKYDLNGDYSSGLEVDGVMYEEYSIDDYETDIGVTIHRFTSISDLNELAELVQGNEEEFSAIYEVLRDLDDSIRVLENKEYLFIPGVKNDNDLGQEWVEMGMLGIEVPDQLKDYLDYESIGRDLYFDYTEYGAIQIY